MMLGDLNVEGVNLLDPREQKPAHHSTKERKRTERGHQQIFLKNDSTTNVQMESEQKEPRHDCLEPQNESSKPEKGVDYRKPQLERVRKNSNILEQGT